MKERNIRLKKNTTYKFTIIGKPTRFERDPPEGIISHKKWERFVFPVIMDDNIFIQKLEVGARAAYKMANIANDVFYRTGKNHNRFQIDVGGPDDFKKGTYIKVYALRDDAWNQSYKDLVNEDHNQNSSEVAMDKVEEAVDNYYKSYEEILKCFNLQYLEGDISFYKDAYWSIINSMITWVEDASLKSEDLQKMLIEEGEFSYSLLIIRNEVKSKCGIYTLVVAENQCGSKDALIFKNSNKIEYKNEY